MDDCVSADQPVSRNNVEELCRVALLEVDAAEKPAVRRWASGGLLENT